jgi:hypothetical protein
MEVTLLGYTPDGLIVAPVVLYFLVQTLVQTLLLVAFVVSIKKCFDSK